ncbi:hypothetical protein NQ315_010649 [Exocentrus adspersus]|uniref:Uncharacterized protein n=1 Tax=Exocentrus adspersus TaxID=1586481 RepID=A0AAV8W5N1_9CUCU|nr:hypothetical protein NQ315_010649 [Exocentrus adspersus]
MSASFTLHGHVNSNNHFAYFNCGVIPHCRYWADENLHWMRECHTQGPEKINVWAGIIGDHIVGPINIFR